MPPKKSKKVKKKNDKRHQDGTKEEVLTFKEAVMNHQLQLKQAQLSSLRDNLQLMKKQQSQQKHKNSLLIKEQDRHIKDVVKEARQNELEEEAVTKVPFEQVEDALAEKLATTYIEAQTVEETREILEGLLKELARLYKELQNLANYKEDGQYIDEKHIHVLVKEMQAMDDSYDEMAEIFDKSFASIKLNIMKENEENLTKDKQLASQLAIENLDKHSEKELIDNKWLLKELHIHHTNINKISRDVATLEKQNIDLMAELFDQRTEYHTRFTNAVTIAEKSTLPLKSIEYSTEQRDDDFSYFFSEWNMLPTEEDCKLGMLDMNLLRVVGTKMPIHASDDVARASYKEFSDWFQ